MENKQNQLTHWRKLTNPNYLGSHDFQPNQEVKVTIERVENADIEDMAKTDVIDSRLLPTSTKQ